MTPPAVRAVVAVYIRPEFSSRIAAISTTTPMVPQVHLRLETAFFLASSWAASIFLSVPACRARFRFFFSVDALISSVLLFYYYSLSLLDYIGKDCTIQE